MIFKKKTSNFMEHTFIIFLTVLDELNLFKRN